MNTTNKTSFLTEMENKLAGFGAMDAMDEKELLEDIDKMLSTALDWMNEGKEVAKDKEVEANMLKMQKIIREKGFVESLDKAIREAEKMRKSEREKPGQDSLLSSAWLMTHLFRSCYSSLCFLLRSGKYKELYDLMSRGNLVLGGYYDWKEEGLSYLQSILTSSFLLNVLRSLEGGVVSATRYRWSEGPFGAVVNNTVREIFRYVDKAYGEHLDVVTPARPLSAEDRQGLSAEVYDAATGMFCFPLGFKGWLGRETGENGRYVVAFSGTQLSDAGMLYADAEQAVGPSLIYACAVGLVDLFTVPEKEIYVCGHSLGGGLTQFSVAACRHADVKGWGFNSAGLSIYATETLQDRFPQTGLIGNVRHYVTAGDPVSKLGALLGSLYVLPGSEGLGHSRDDLRRAMGM